MTPDEYSSWLTLGNHTPEAMALITRIRNSEPSRRVRGGRSNVIASFPSKKMGFTIQAESHRVELPIIHKFENDDSVLEYYDQPEPIKISWSRKDGRKVTVFSTVDFFLLMRDGRAGWVECKTEEDLKRQSLESNRFVIDDYGTWHCPCGEEYATLFGFFFTVETNANINWTYYRNTNYLQDYFRDEATIISQERKTYITALVSAMQGTCLATLYDMQDELSRDDILFLVAKGDLYINLEAHDLAMPKNAPVYTSELIAKSHIDTYAVQKAASIEPSGFILDIGCLVSWDSKPYRIINLGEQEIWMESLDGNIAHL